MSDFFYDLENLNLHPPPNSTSENFYESLENLNDVEPDEEEEEEEEEEEKFIHESITGDIMLIPDGHGSLSRTAFLVSNFQGKTRAHKEFILPRHPTGASSPAMDVLGCCNGLIFLCTSLDKNPVAVLNLMTKEYVCFPRNKGLRANTIGCECSSCSEHDELESDEPVLTSGFCYSPKGKEFKAVRVVPGGGRDLFLRRRSSESGSSRDYDEGYRVLGEVYILGEEKWRKRKGIAPRMSRFMSSGIYCNGKFYWVCSNKDGVFEFLATFDFDEEQFGLIPPPESKAHGISKFSFPKWKEFKAVRVVPGGERDLSLGRRSSGEEGYRVLGEVYVLGEEKWRKSKGIAPRMSCFMSSGIYCNGKFYWVSSNKDHVFEFLATFDFDEEQFGLIPPPERATKKWARHIRLLDFESQLSLLDFSSASQVSIWMLSEPAPPNGGRQRIEGPVVPMRHGNITEPIKVKSFYDEKLVLLMHESRTLVGYNFTLKEFVIYELKAGICACYRAVACPRRLVWLKNVAKGSGGHIQVIKITEPFIKKDRFRGWPVFEPVREPSLTIRFGRMFLEAHRDNDSITI